MNPPDNNSVFPYIRMRRLRSHPSVREMLRSNFIEPSRLVWPVFVEEGVDKIEEIADLPGQFSFTVDRISEGVAPVLESGVRAVLLFPIIQQNLKTDDGSEMISTENLICRTIACLRSSFPELIIFADLDLSEYTIHGHSGIINQHGIVENDATMKIVAKASEIFCSAGAHGVAPSGMLDGQVTTIRETLDSGGYSESLILSYSTKFSSNFYDCFRKTVGNSPKFGGRADCQIPYCDIDQALRESKLDEQESADILMVKPALAYLDVIYQIKQATHLPLAVFHVSGEYAMLWNADRLGFGDRYALAHEVLSGIFRAGADLVITYWANQINAILEKGLK